MIKHIQGGRGIIVGQDSGSPPYVNMSNPSAGMVRYNGYSYTLEVYDGSSWIPFNQHVTIATDTMITEAVDWVHEQMRKEKAVKELAEKNLAVSAALEKVKEAEQELETVIILAKDHGTR